MASEDHYSDAVDGSRANDTAKLRAMFGPQAVDNAVRKAISTCWMMMPKNKKTVDAVEAEIRRLVERAFADLREDASSFGDLQGAG